MTTQTQDYSTPDVAFSVKHLRVVEQYLSTLPTGERLIERHGLERRGLPLKGTPREEFHEGAHFGSYKLRKLVGDIPGLRNGELSADASIAPYVDYSILGTDACDVARTTGFALAFCWPVAILLVLGAGGLALRRLMSRGLGLPAAWVPPADTPEKPTRRGGRGGIPAAWIPPVEGKSGSHGSRGGVPAGWIPSSLASEGADG